MILRVSFHVNSPSLTKFVPLQYGTARQVNISLHQYKFYRIHVHSLITIARDSVYSEEKVKVLFFKD